MEEYAGRVLADRYRLPLPPADEYELVETHAFDTYSGQEVHLRQIPLPEVVDAEVVDEDARWGGAGGPSGRNGTFTGAGRTARGSGDPAVQRAIKAATSAAQIPDHPRLGQVFHVFAEAGSLWIVSELVAGRPLAALLAEGTLSPHRAAEVANDVLTALGALHAHGWVHRNVTARTVLLCDDGRAMLTGLAAGAAEEALCGYDPVPAPTSSPAAPADPSVEEPGSADAPASLPQGPAGSGDHPSQAPGRAKSGDEGRASIPGARTPENGEARPHGGPRYRDQGAPGGFPPPGRPYGGHEPAGTGSRPDPDDREHGHGRQGAAAGLPEPREPYGDHGAAETSSEPGTGGPVYRDQVTFGPGTGGPMAPYRDQGAAGGLPGPRREGERRESERRESERREGERGGGAADAPSAARGAGQRHRRLRGGRAGRRAGQCRRGHPLPARSRAPTPAPEPDPEPVSGGARWPAQPEESAGPAASEGGGSWDSGGATGGGPATALAAERARQARIVVVGAVTERWAPEQGGPVHANWRLAPPVGPAADLWALGALLFRAVQGHAPYPEENAAELVQMVCAEAPAYAEECGPLRPVVESLMRQDPTERPDFEELRGWLRSLIRSAPEPDVGSSTVTVPSLGSGGASDPRRLPIVRRRGWLVRRGKGRRPAAAQAEAPPGHARHRRDKREKRDNRQPRQAPAPAPASAPTQRKPRRLGRMLLLLILLALAAAVLYATMFMPRAKDDGGQGRTGSAGTPSAPAAGGDHRGEAGKPADPGDPGDQEPQSTDPAGLEKGFAVRKDPKGFKVAVHEDWTRRGENGRGQIRYIGGDFELVVVAGRDKMSEFGGDPMVYQQDREAELSAFRSSSWASSSGLRRIDVGRTAMAEGAFNWRDSSGRNVYARNLAMLIDGRYHVVLVIGPSDERSAVNRYFEQATATYSTTNG
ncbi:serine/threonine protein kinase [Streptomyces malaysiensis subsp. malaysiensis]|uniref:protein kinase n=1 Tax=Streptomyces malaysiensis TaxID=92644 RepID=UPI00115ED5A7|nr:protein kinase [Streptomyces malaysiensis]QDL71360.1 serine/threonine protein kinase [Streptomyces malaysiensis]